MTTDINDLITALRNCSTTLYGYTDAENDEALAEELEKLQASLYKTHAAAVHVLWLQQPEHQAIPLERVKAQVMQDVAGRRWRYVESYGDMFDSLPCIGCGRLLSDLYIGWMLEIDGQQLFECYTCSGHPYFYPGTAPADVCQECYGTGFTERTLDRYCTVCHYHNGPGTTPLTGTALMVCGHPWWEWTVLTERVPCFHEASHDHQSE